MEGIDKEQILDKVKKFASKYLLYVLVILIVIILIILLIPVRTTDEKAINLAKKYIKANNIFLTNVERELSFEQIGMKMEDNCIESGLVLASTNGYKVFYVCDNAPSKDMLALLRTNQIALSGTNPFYVRYGTVYYEPGYYMSDDDVIVKTSGLVVNTVGMYLLKYEGIGNGKYLKSNRIVIITKKRFVSYPSISLKGDQRIVLVKGTRYEEPGYEAYDSNDGIITRNVRVDGYVNVERIGKYDLKYIVTNSSGKMTEAHRYITVVNNTSPADFTLTASTTTITNSDVTLNISVTGDGFDFILDPDGNIITLAESNYKVTENGTYEFSLKKKDGTVIEKSIDVTNIDKTKPTGSCKSTVYDTKTVVSVTANDTNGIKKYSYTVGTNKNESTSNSYTVNSSIKTTPTVTVYDNAGNYQMISCVVEDKTTPPTPTPTPTPTDPPSTAKHYQELSYNGMNYIVYYPDDLNLSNKNPLVIFLHGDGEVGTSISRLSGLVFVKNMKSGKFKNAVYLAPQRSGGSHWNSYIPTLKSLINMIVSTYNIDTRRISITGHSSGGMGVYTIIGQNPTMFSAGVVVSGLNKDGNVSNLTSTPMRHYHGTNDSNVAYSKGQASAQEVKNAGGNIEFIPLQGKYHAITSDVYNGTDAIDWMIRQSR